MKKRIIESYIVLAIITVFMGQFYLNPSTLGFRLSFAVVALSLSLIFFKKIKIMPFCVIVGILMFSFRSFVEFFSVGNLSLSSTLLLYLPVISFYVSYGILFSYLDVRDELHKPKKFFLALWFCDSVSNIIEVLIRAEWTNTVLDRLILMIIIMGFLRTLLTYVVYWISLRYITRFNDVQKEKYFEELMIFTASLKTELFFLKKSRHDIEDAMFKSHSLYEKVGDSEIKSDLLTIAKDIHEIQKDYKRVIAGMSATLNREAIVDAMSSIEIMDIIKENGVNIGAEMGKDIEINMYHHNVFRTKHFYSLISVINNIIINAIEAVPEQGQIDITYYHEKNIAKFTISDNGPGIEHEDLEFIFDAGFSTKYDEVSGLSSTGIGLTHVKQIVDEYFEGAIRVESEVNKGTRFIIVVPREKLMEV